MDRRARILKFAQNQELIVLSTVSADGTPESATVECTVTDSLEIIFQTFRQYRKYKNLLFQRRISAVFGWRDAVTVQYEGEAEELRGELLSYYRELYLRKIPSAKRFAEMEGATLFRVRPIWSRYTDISKEPSEVYELDLSIGYVPPEQEL